MKRHGVIVTPGAGLGATFNPAAARSDDGRYIMLVRSVPEGYRKIGAVNEFDDKYNSRLSLWEGSSPDHFSLVDSSAIKPDQPYDRYGVEDPASPGSATAGTSAIPPSPGAWRRPMPGMESASPWPAPGISGPSPSTALSARTAARRPAPCLRAGAACISCGRMKRMSNAR